MSVTERTIYEMFSEVYYKRAFRAYTNDECSVTESIQCLLKSFFQRKLRRALHEPKIVILSFGSIVHEALREPLIRRKYEVEKEISVAIRDVLMYAHGDAVHTDHGLEFKTITARPTRVLSHHYLQANSYTYMFQKPLWYVDYIHKPSGYNKVFSVIPNEEAFRYVTLRAYRLCTCLRSNTMPPPEPSWLCTYCEYRDLCPNPAPMKRSRWY